jgi:hypothetical protein
VITIVLTLARHSFQWRCGGMIGTFAAGFALVAGWYFGKADLLLHNRLKRMVLGLQRDPTSQPTLPAPLGRKVRAIATMNR